MKITKVTLGQKNYPQLLAQIPGAPKQLYCLGEPLNKLLEKSAIAVVGSRKVTAYGKQVTTDIVEALSRRGLVIVSGLAIGLDGIAHQAALNVGGKTIAVLPTGLNKIHPAMHRQLAMDILAKGGALITEYPIDAPIFKTNFVARNRIVTGLSQGLLIPEAAEKSGTLHTAGFALEQGREVFAVPGNITSQFSAGTNNLIKTGAIPVTDVNDILRVLGIEEQSIENIEITADNEQQKIVLTLLLGGTTQTDELLKSSGLTTVSFNQTLTMLEITGRVRPAGNGHWNLA